MPLFFIQIDILDDMSQERGWCFKIKIPPCSPFLKGSEVNILNTHKTHTDYIRFSENATLVSQFISNILRCARAYLALFLLSMKINAASKFACEKLCVYGESKVFSKQKGDTPTPLLANLVSRVCSTFGLKFVSTYCPEIFKRDTVNKLSLKLVLFFAK